MAFLRADHATTIGVSCTRRTLGGRAQLSKSITAVASGGGAGKSGDARTAGCRYAMPLSDPRPGAAWPAANPFTCNHWDRVYSIAWTSTARTCRTMASHEGTVISTASATPARALSAVKLARHQQGRDHWPADRRPNLTWLTKSLNSTAAFRLHTIRLRRLRQDYKTSSIAWPGEHQRRGVPCTGVDQRHEPRTGQQLFKTRE